MHKLTRHIHTLFENLESMTQDAQTCYTSQQSSTKLCLSKFETNKLLLKERQENKI